MDYTKLRKIASKEISEANIAEMFAESYSKILDISIEDAKKIVEMKLNKHLNSVSLKFERAIENDAFNDVIKSKDENTLDEYLEEKTVIKG